MKSLLAAFSLTLSSAAPSAAQIYADFETSMGEFTCELNHTAAPHTVANFIGLAEGSRPWIDPANGIIRSGVPFYHGITFHRVIAGFMNQSGSRNALGTDGPGYTFRDETENGLKHLGPGVLSMANSGLHTNGSQFFITVGTAAHLDGLHTVFGSVTSGLDIVTSINQVPTNTSNNKPLSPVTITSIAIRRVGPAAEAFSIHDQKLPEIRSAAGTLQITPGISTTFNLNEPLPHSSIIQVFRSPDLASWAKLGELFQDIPTQETGVTFDAATLPKAFYHIPIITYPDAKFPPLTAGKTLRIQWSPSAGITHHLLVNFDATGLSGTVFDSSSNTTRTITNVDYFPELFTATWVIYTAEAAPIGIIADYKSETPVHITGIQERYNRPAGWVFANSGTFTLTK